MKLDPSKSPWLRWLLASLAGLVSCLMAQTTQPPNRMSYQGYVLGDDGQPLGASAPKAYDMVFQIFDAETSGDLLWAEQQAAVVDRGYFVVQLGEGIPVAGFTNSAAGLPAVFANTPGNSRWVQLMVKGAGAGGSDRVVSPRVRFLSAPYAYLAQAAARMVDSTGNEIMSMSSTNLLLSAGLTTPLLSTPTLSVGNITISNALNILGGTTSGEGGFVRTSDGSLRIVAGRHRWTNNVFPLEPSAGYSITMITNGEFKVTFDTAFNSPPAVTATPIKAGSAGGAYGMACQVIQSYDPAEARKGFTLRVYMHEYNSTYSMFIFSGNWLDWYEDRRRDFYWPQDLYQDWVFVPRQILPAVIGMNSSVTWGFSFVASGN